MLITQGNGFPSFCLYVKEHNERETFVDDDFDCHEFICEQNAQSQGDDGTRIPRSYLDHEPKEGNVVQLDGFNCGVISLIQYIEIFNDLYLFQDFDGEEHHEYLLRFRLQLLLLIRDLYDLFNDKYYNHCPDHLFMEERGPSKSTQFGKFYMIHQLFNKNVYTHKPNSKYPKQFCNTNSVKKNKL